MKFECQTNCGKCCTGEGFVYLNESDIRRLANYFGFPPSWVTESICKKDKDGHWILDNSFEGCMFLREGWKCSIHDSKPTQCRTFPFWPNIDFKKIAEWCPGVGVGKEYDKEEITALEKETDNVLPGFQLVAR